MSCVTNANSISNTGGIVLGPERYYTTLRSASSSCADSQLTSEFHAERTEKNPESAPDVLADALSVG